MKARSAEGVLVTVIVMTWDPERPAMAVSIAVFVIFVSFARKKLNEKKKKKKEPNDEEYNIFFSKHMS